MRKLVAYIISASANVRAYLTKRLSKFAQTIISYRTLAEARWKMKGSDADNKKITQVALVDSDMQINGKSGQEYIKSQFPSVSVYSISNKIKESAGKPQENQGTPSTFGNAKREKTIQEMAIDRLRLAAIEARKKNRDEYFKEKTAKAIQARKDRVMESYREMTALEKQTNDLKAKRIIMMNSLAEQIIKVDAKSTIIRSGMIAEYKHHFSKLYGSHMTFSDAKEAVLLTRSQIKAKNEAKRHPAGGSGQAA